MTPYLKLEIHLPETDHFWYKVGPKTSSKWLQVYMYMGRPIFPLTYLFQAIYRGPDNSMYNDRKTCINS